MTGDLLPAGSGAGGIKSHDGVEMAKGDQAHGKPAAATHPPLPTPQRAQALPPVPRKPPEAASKPAIAIGAVPPAPVVVQGTVYPWDPRPELIVKAAACEARGQVQVFDCRTNSFLNTAAEGDLLGVAVKSHFRVYPDMVGVEGRPPGWLERLLMYLIGFFGLLLCLPLAPVGCLFAIPAFIMGVFLWVLRILLTPVVLLFAFLAKVFFWDRVAAFIRQNPQSRLAIWLLHRFEPLLPMYWDRQDTVQLVRLNVRRMICGSRYLLLLVRDRPIPAGGSILEFLLGFLPFCGRRRIYMMAFTGDEAVADVATTAASRALLLPVTTAHVARRGRLTLS